jgi:hypothetical protein
LALVGTGFAFSNGHERNTKEKAMKNGMKRLVGLVALMTFACTSCAGVQVPVKTASDVRNLKVEDGYQYKYKVTFRDGTSQSFDDDEIDTKGNLIGIRNKNERDFHYYDSNDVVSVERKRKTNWGKGAAIGAGAGAAVGGGAVAAAAFGSGSCSGDDIDSDMRGLCSKGFRVGMSVAGAAVGALIGMGIGAGIGAAIPKKKKSPLVNVSVSPKVYTTQKMKIQGAGVGISGSF